MCGIAALIGKAPANELENYSREMLSTISHRGPDGEGTISAPNIALGHRRLAIVDLTEAGAQPMASSDNRFWITYNGEIYNAPEIRRELEKMGVSFSSTSDTEVILASYAKWGRACLPRFNGMFAFVIWDQQENEVFVARDRFGVKPLYYWVSPSGILAFASEIKEFTRLPGWVAKLNRQRAYDFLVWSITDHTDETLFEGVRHIPPGAMASIDVQNYVPQESLETTHWYKLHKAAASLQKDNAEQYVALLEDSIKLRLRADVPIGSCLSGGLDSTAVVALVQEQLKVANAPERQKTFSAVFPGDPIDESAAISMTESFLGISNFKTTPSADSMNDSFDKLIWHQDEPFTSTSVFAQYEVFKLAKQHGVKVVLDGQGADEQLAGYQSFFGPHLFGTLVDDGPFAYARELKAISKQHGISLPRLAMMTFNHSAPDFIRKLGRHLFSRSDATGIWLNDSAVPVYGRDPWRRNGRKIRSASDFSSALLTSMNLQMLLRYEDRNSMASSVEARVPFLDYRLVELSLALPARMKIREGQTKWVLREGMTGKIPEAIRTNHRKIGFEAPETRWFSRTTNGFKHEEIVWPLDLLSETGKQLISDYESGAASFSPILFRLMCFERWRELFSVIPSESPRGAVPKLL